MCGLPARAPTHRMVTWTSEPGLPTSHTRSTSSLSSTCEHKCAPLLPHSPTTAVLPLGGGYHGPGQRRTLRAFQGHPHVLAGGLHSPHQVPGAERRIGGRTITAPGSHCGSKPRVQVHGWLPSFATSSARWPRDDGSGWTALPRYGRAPRFRERSAEGRTATEQVARARRGGLGGNSVRSLIPAGQQS